MLRLEHISVAYGKHEALHDVSLEAQAGRTTVILGANGAGKTTLLKTIAGFVRARPGGRILLDGRAIEHAPPHNIVERGIALVPEGRGLFGDLTVHENLRLGAFPKHARAHEAAQFEKMLALFPRLAERGIQLARTMSGGEQQMLAIARALMSEPKILLLDEPSLGLSPRLVKDLFSALRRITAGGQAVMLVEQNVHHSLRLADHVYVLENGHIVKSGSAAEIREDTVIQQAYLGLEDQPMDKRVEKRSEKRVEKGGVSGFVNPFARSVSARIASKEAETPREAARMATVNGTGGFVNPFARSVSHQKVVLGVTKARKENTAGFYNPLARPEK
jgi:branched-chain amino acid transport system ATP-binding protein